MKLRIPYNKSKVEIQEMIRFALEKKNPDLVVEAVTLPNLTHCYVKLDKIIAHTEDDTLWFERSERHLAFELVPSRCKHVREVV